MEHTKITALLDLLQIEKIRHDQELDEIAMQLENEWVDDPKEDSMSHSQWNKKIRVQRFLNADRRRESIEEVRLGLLLNLCTLDLDEKLAMKLDETETAKLEKNISQLTDTIEHIKELQSGLFKAS